MSAVVPTLRHGASAHRRYGPDGDAEGYVQSLVTRWRTSAPDVTGLVHYDAISPADGLREHLLHHPAGLVVVTTHARSGVERVFLGADAARIVQQSSAPALVVPLLTD